MFFYRFVNLSSLSEEAGDGEDDDTMRFAKVLRILSVDPSLLPFSGILLLKVMRLIDIFFYPNFLYFFSNSFDMNFTCPMLQCVHLQQEFVGTQLPHHLEQ